MNRNVQEATDGGRSHGARETGVELVEAETQGEAKSQGPRMTQKAWRAMVEPQVAVTEVEVWTWQTRAETWE